MPLMKTKKLVKEGRIIQIVESMNQIHALDEYGNVWFLVRSADLASEAREWVLLVSNEAKRDQDLLGFVTRRDAAMKIKQGEAS